MLASAKYGGEFIQRGLKPPAIFNEDVVSMMPEDNPDGQIFIRAPSTLGDLVVKNFRGVCDSAFTYVTDFEPSPPRYDGHITADNERQISNSIGSLLVPPQAITGRLSHIGVEAVTREELTKGILEPLLTHATILRREQTRAVFFVVSGEFRISAYTPQPRFGIAAAYMTKGTLPTPCFVTAPLGLQVAARWVESRS